MMLHDFSSKFRVGNDARNEHFKKQLLSEMLVFVVGTGYEKFEFPANKKNHSLRESNCTLKKVLWVFQSSCILCVLHCVCFFFFFFFFCHGFVNLLVKTKMSIKTKFDEFVKTKPTFSV